MRNRLSVMDLFLRWASNLPTSLKFTPRWMAALTGGSRVSRDGAPSEASDGTKNALIISHISTTQGQRMELAAIS